MTEPDLPDLVLPAAPGRLIVLGVRPEDGTAGAGGLIYTAALAGWRVEVISATAGAASLTAVTGLAPGAEVSSLRMPGGSLADQVPGLVAALVATIGTHGRGVVICAPWRRDGHPDHGAVGEAAAVAAGRTDARLIEYPVRLGHRGDDRDRAWRQARQLRLTGPAQEAKLSVMSILRRTAPRSAVTDATGVARAALETRTGRDREIFFDDDEPISDDALDHVHRERDDPWQVDSGYERRKRAVTLASLPRERYESGLEVGCSVGALAVDLAERCGHLLAIDASETAVAAAHDRTSALASVEVRRAAVPAQWPPGRFDLISISEVGYFLSPRQLALTVEHSFGSLVAPGHLLLCHWRHQPVGWPLAGPAVHEAFLATGAPVLVEHQEPDFLLHVLGRPAWWDRGSDGPVACPP